MSQNKNSLLTQIYIKPRDDTPWPKDSVFYMVTSNGLFLCRNNRFFTSSVRAPRWPTELAQQESFLSVRYPKVSRRLLEYIVGYFAKVARLHGSEAAVLLAYNERRQRVQAVVPEQVVTVSRNLWGDVYPIGVEYEIPADLDPELTIIGDVHSHVDGAAYSSYVDKHDETHRAGLHIVVGRINREPPEFHIEAVTDGVRFLVDEEVIFGGYQQRRLNVPRSWLEKITVKTYGSKSYNTTSTQGTGHAAGGWGGNGGQGKKTHYGYSSGQVDKSDGYGDYGGGNGAKAGGSTAQGKVDDEEDRRPKVYKLGYDDPADDDADEKGTTVQGDTGGEASGNEAIRQEILQQLDDTKHNQPRGEDQQPEGGTAR